MQNHDKSLDNALNEFGSNPNNDDMSPEMNGEDDNFRGSLMKSKTLGPNGSTIANAKSTPQNTIAPPKKKNLNFMETVIQPQKER